MIFKEELTEGKILKRYKRFLADIELSDGQIMTVHTPNTGSMKTCWAPGWPCRLSRSSNPKRKYPYTLEMTHNGESWIGINTSLANHLVNEAILSQQIDELTGFQEVKREVKTGHSRIDFVLKYPAGRPECYLEVKNVTLKGDNKQALFPDAVSERGTKHLKELIRLRQEGKRSVIFYIVQRNDIDTFSPAKEIDPTYAQTLKEAQDAGVEILCYQWSVGPRQIELKEKMTVKL
jgi:sugar fermentation stimulation protein A